MNIRAGIGDWIVYFANTQHTIFWRFNGGLNFLTPPPLGTPVRRPATSETGVQQCTRYLTNLRQGRYKTDVTRARSSLEIMATLGAEWASSALQPANAPVDCIVKFVGSAVQGARWSMRFRRVRRWWLSAVVWCQRARAAPPVSSWMEKDRAELWLPASKVSASRASSL